MGTLHYLYFSIFAIIVPYSPFTLYFAPFNICSVCYLQRWCFNACPPAPAVNSSPLFAAVPHNPPCQRNNVARCSRHKNTNNELQYFSIKTLPQNCAQEQWSLVFWWGNQMSFNVIMLTTGQLETNRECSEAWASWTQWPLSAVWRHNYLRAATGVWPMQWARACWGASGAWRQGWRRHKQGTKAPRMWRPAVAFVRHQLSSTSLERHPSGCNALKPQYFEKSMFCFVVTLGSFCQNYHCHRMYTHKSSTYRPKIS